MAHFAYANEVPESCVVKRCVAMLVGQVHIRVGTQYLNTEMEGKEKGGRSKVRRLMWGGG